jgi:hypothetical protein
MSYQFSREEAESLWRKELQRAVRYSINMERAAAHLYALLQRAGDDLHPSVRSDVLESHADLVYPAASFWNDAQNTNDEYKRRTDAKPGGAAA